MPVSLPQQYIEAMTQQGEAIAEPFAGSGTTIIAAENLSRRCYACEISPNYGAVILERFATAFPHLEIKRLD
jgi:DNA modification methylase